MNRKQWIIFMIALPGLLGTVLSPIGEHHPLVPAFFFVLLLGGTFGWDLFRAVYNFWLRRAGVPMTGRVIHARSSGYVNHAPNWEIEVQLPNGTIAKLMTLRYGGFTPGEPVDLMVNPRHPNRAVIAPGPPTDF